MPATIRDVAREAGVSVATVSRVLNASGPVRAETRDRIHEVARRLQFFPNPTARNLSTRTTHTVGVVLPELHGEFFSELIRGIDQTVRRLGFHALISSSHSERADMDAALSAMQGRVDGLLVLAADGMTSSMAREAASGAPIVMINASADDAGAYSSVEIDNFGGAAAATRHLLEHGHREIAMVAGPHGNRDAGERERGFAAALHERGLHPRADWIAAGDFTEQSGYAAARALLSMPLPPRAIFFANDNMAVGGLRAIRECGMGVPEDVAVVGFDDVRTAAYFTPALTTVHVGIRQLGEKAARRLLHAITTGDTTPSHAVLPTRLIVRDSCGAHSNDRSSP
jgi:LacI family transcriptional regulator